MTKEQAIKKAHEWKEKNRAHSVEYVVYKYRGGYHFMDINSAFFNGVKPVYKTK